MPEKFNLNEFLPFRLNRVAAVVSNRMSEIYSDRFGIDIPEWRVMATLGAEEPTTAQAVVRSTRTHKSTISRAVARLIDLGWIERITSDDDRRELQLRFTTRGREKFDALLPDVLAFERALYETLPDQAGKSLLDGLGGLERALGLDENSD